MAIHSPAVRRTRALSDVAAKRIDAVLDKDHHADELKRQARSELAQTFYDLFVAGESAAEAQKRAGVSRTHFYNLVEEVNQQRKQSERRRR